MAAPRYAEILLLEAGDELEDVEPGTHLPKVAMTENMRQLFDMETLRDIVDFERKRNATASISGIIFAINFTVKKMSFLIRKDRNPAEVCRRPGSGGVKFAQLAVP